MRAADILQATSNAFEDELYGKRDSVWKASKDVSAIARAIK